MAQHTVDLGCGTLIALLIIGLLIAEAIAK